MLESSKGGTLVAALGFRGAVSGAHLLLLPQTRSRGKQRCIVSSLLHSSPAFTGW